MIAVYIDGLGCPFAGSVYIRAAAKGVLREVVGSIYPDTPFCQYLEVIVKEVKPVMEFWLKARIADDDIQGVVIGPYGLQLIKAGLVHAAIIAELHSFLGIESIAERCIGIPVDKSPLCAGIRVKIALIKPCKADA